MSGGQDMEAAFVFCPMWSNVPPIGLAYVKGAVRNRQVRCFDFNIRFYKRFYPDWQSRFEAPFPGIRMFATVSVDWAEFERACAHFAVTHAEALEEWLRELAPFRVVGLSIYQENIVAATALGRRLRAAGKTVLAGGPSMTMDGNLFAGHLLRTAAVDLVVTGIAEDVIEACLDALLDGNGDARALPGVLFLAEDGQVRMSRPKPPSLDGIRVVPDYDDFDLSEYYADRCDTIYIYAAIGCMARCEFCTIHEMYSKYNRKSTDTIKHEISSLHEKYGVTKFFFSDSMFLGNREAAAEIFNFAIERGFRLGLQIRLMPYWDDEELVDLAARCVFFFQVGLESASAVVRRAMRKMAGAEITDSILGKMLARRLPLYTNVIVGYPNETEEEFQRTLDFVDRYVQAEGVLGIGANTFFIPNDFPREKYGITFDRDGRWRSPAVSAVARLERVRRMIAAAEKHGRHRGMVWLSDTVEGLPIDHALPPEWAEGVVFRKLGRPTLPYRAGWLDEARVEDGEVILRGWALDPLTNGQAAAVVFTAASGLDVVAVARVGLERSDVLAAAGVDASVRPGWWTHFPVGRLGGCRQLQAWVVGRERTAYPLDNFQVEVEQ